MAITILRFVNIILAALLAGTSFGIWMGFNPAHFSPSIYAALQQNTIRVFNVLMISLVIIATIITIASAFLQRNDKHVFIGLLVAAVFFIACILISRFGNKPIQDVMLKWNPDLLPANWTVLRDKWWSYHIMRTITELISLSIITWVGIRKENITIADKSITTSMD